MQGGAPRGLGSAGETLRCLYVSGTPLQPRVSELVSWVQPSSGVGGADIWENCSSQGDLWCSALRQACLGETLCLLLVSLYVVSDSLHPHGLQDARLPCPPLSPRVCSDSCPLSQ